MANRARSLFFAVVTRISWPVAAVMLNLMASPAFLSGRR